MKNEEFSAMKNPMYMSLIEMDLLWNEQYSQVNVLFKYSENKTF